MTFASRDIVPLGYAAFAFTLGVTWACCCAAPSPPWRDPRRLHRRPGPHPYPRTTESPVLHHRHVRRRPGHHPPVRRDLHGRRRHDIHIGELPIPRGADPVHPTRRRRLGQVVPVNVTPAASRARATPRPDGIAADKTAACLARYDLHETITYQPANRYWPLQWYETGIFLALAAACPACAPGGSGAERTDLAIARGRRGDGPATAFASPRPQGENGLQCPSETTSTEPSVTLMAV